MPKLTNLLRGAVAALTLSAAALSAHAAFTGERTDFRDETIYFAMTTRFYDGDPANNVLCWDNQQAQISTKDPCWRGDFKGLIERLDYIKALGFTAVWITPVVQNASGYDYHGYHAMDFSRVDLRYLSRKDQGSAEDVDFQDLIDAVHARGMKIILDVVLQHTCNFGEDHFARLFTRDQKISNQASISACMKPETDKLGTGYWDLPSIEQYNRRICYLKNTDGTNKDSHNYWHHMATQWNWDEPSRWWGQIAGDCVDLNTENNAVTDYIIECYGNFIAMGVDGFRIDTTGHISRLTMNKTFIPAFIALGEKYKDRRPGNAPFYIFGECCARYSEVIYRGQHCLSSHFYTWQSPQSLLDRWNSDPTWWDNQFVPEDAEPLGNMLLCLEDNELNTTSDNAFLKNGRWHEPDYSQASGFNVIDFPMHYNFSNAGSAVNIAQQGDKYYNDATWNVVYVDSHDYGPQPNDAIRFNGGTAQWAENLSLMFTFRGIPCIYYGSEVEFQKGKKIDNGPNGPLANTGRAYFGEYLTGSVTASDFGEYTASGNVSKTLGADLAQHIIRLNRIRAAVPALRKGQYTFDGCSGSYAFKRAWKDSYALVAVNGGATFSGLPAGTYVDVVTGQSYSATEGGSITVSAPSTQGQLRVLVKDWTGGKIGDDGKFIYTSAPVAKGGDVSFTDPGTDSFFTAEDAVSDPAVILSPDGGNFVDNVTVTASLRKGTESGTYQIGDAAPVSFTSTATFTLGQDMEIGQSVTVRWTATNSEGTTSGAAVFTRIEQPAGITVFYDNTETLWTKMLIHHWSVEQTTWPGVAMMPVSGTDNIWTYTVPAGTTGVIFNGGGNGVLYSVDVTGANIKHMHLYKGTPGSGPASITDMGIYASAVTDITADGPDASAPEYYTIQGVRVLNPTAPGLYIVRRGTHITKRLIR